MLGFAESNVRKLIIREIIFEEFQRVWSQSTNVTDGQTTYHGNTALRYASHGELVGAYARGPAFCWVHCQHYPIIFQFKSAAYFDITGAP